MRKRWQASADFTAETRRDMSHHPKTNEEARMMNAELKR